MKKKIYITGVSGTGKSTLGLELQKRGCFVIDIDEGDLCTWCDKAGNRVCEDRDGIAWLDEHHWNCDIQRLEKEIEESADDHVFIVGISSNLDNYPFDKILLLSVDPETLVKRLTERTTNDFAKDPEEQQFVLKMKDEYEKKMSAKGAVFLDGWKPVSELANNIIKNLGISKK